MPVEILLKISPMASLLATPLPLSVAFCWPEAKSPPYPLLECETVCKVVGSSYYKIFITQTTLDACYALIEAYKVLRIAAK